MYTAHGKHIPYTFLADEKPEEVYPCGGPSMCPPCTLEALPYMPMWNGLQRSMIIEKGTKETKMNSVGGVVPEDRPEMMSEGGMQLKARTLIRDTFYHGRDGFEGINYWIPVHDVYVVWFAKTLQNWKALISTNVKDDMYYEVTYNGDKQEAYLDAYKKVHNVCVPD